MSVGSWLKYLCICTKKLIRNDRFEIFVLKLYYRHVPARVCGARFNNAPTDYSICLLAHLQAPHGGWVRHTQQGTITAQWRRLSLERCGVGCPCCHFLSRGTCATPPSPLRTLSPTHSPSLSRSHPLSHAPPHPLSLSSTLTHIQHAVYRCAHVVAFFQTTNQCVC